MDAAERFRRSYFRSGRHTPCRRPLPVAPPLPAQRTARKKPMEKCATCGVERMKRERGRWDSAAKPVRYFHYACTPVEQVVEYIERWGLSTLRACIPNMLLFAPDVVNEAVRKARPREARQ